MRILSSLSLVALAAALVVPSTAYADRSTSLQGNRLLKDQDDVYAFPQQAMTYADRLSLDLGQGGVGNGLLLMDVGGFAIGVGLGRGDAFGSTSLMRNEAAALGSVGLLDADQTMLAPFVNGVPTPHNVADLFFAMGGFGARLSLNSASNTANVPMSSGETSQSTLGLGATLGYGTEMFDVGLNINFQNGSNVNAGDVVESGSRIGVGLLGRAAFEMNKTTDLGVLARVGLRTQSVTTETPVNTTRTASGFDVTLGAGPVLALGERGTLAAYGTIGFSTANGDPATDINNDSASLQVLTVPGANVAAELAVTEWMFVRAGMNYAYNISLAQSLSMAGETSGSTNSSSFGWNTGVGFKFGAFTVDGTLSQDILTQGPDFIGGDAPLFGFLSATYRWDAAVQKDLQEFAAPASDTASVKQPARETVAAPAPAPAPTPAPTPVVESETTTEPVSDTTSDEMSAS